jgi:hypothetical protein
MYSRLSSYGIEFIGAEGSSSITALVPISGDKPSFVNKSAKLISFYGD